MGEKEADALYRVHTTTNREDVLRFVCVRRGGADEGVEE